jgi:hypothetical protein
LQLILITNNIYQMSAGGFLQVMDHPIEQQTHPHPGFSGFMPQSTPAAATRRLALGSLG